MPTYFQFLTLLAFHVFAKHDVDIAVIETGIGGLLDATNVLERPLAVIITSIGLEHVKTLGSTIESITLNKAGIIKVSC
jgi:folylpolyglutamate synthase/dihydropteroate synthase